MATGIGGLAGTFDATSLISGLVAAVKTPQTALQTKITNINSQVSTLGNLVTQVQALGTAVKTLSTASGTQALGVASSSAGIGAGITGTAQAGTYSLSVSQLATSQTSASQTYSTNTAGSAGSGSLTLSTAGGNPVTINYTNASSLSDIASAINNQAGSIAHASVLFDGSTYRLVVNSAQTGSAGALQFSESNGGNLGLADPSSTIVPAQDAKMVMNGLAVTRSSNNVSDVIPGLTLQLTQTTPAGQPATITVANDEAAINTQVNSFVTAFNTLVSSVNAQTTYNGSQAGEDSLFGDTSVRGLRSELGAMMSQGVTGPDGKTVSIGSLGISFNNDGTLVVDSNKLTEAIAANPAAVTNLFVGTGGNGLAKGLSDLVDRYAGSTGQFVTEKQQKQESISPIQDAIAAIDKRASSLQTLLQTQFSKLAEVQLQWSSQSSYLTNLTKASQS